MPNIWVSYLIATPRAPSGPVESETGSLGSVPEAAYAIRLIGSSKER